MVATRSLSKLRLPRCSLLAARRFMCIWSRTQLALPNKRQPNRIGGGLRKPLRNPPRKGRISVASLPRSRPSSQRPSSFQFAGHWLCRADQRLCDPPCETVVREASERERRDRGSGCEPVGNHCEKPSNVPV